MGVIFKWFKSFSVIEHDSTGWFQDNYYEVRFLGGDSTSHSYGNRSLLQDLFETHLGIQIPTDTYDFFYENPTEFYNNLLIKPSEMSKYCKTILDYSNHGVNLYGMEDRILWIKSLSDQGFYVMYDML